MAHHEKQTGSFRPGGISTIWMVGLGFAPAVLLALLRMADVPLGYPGKFTYLYSQLYALRLIHAAALLAPAILFAVCISLSARASAIQRATGRLLGVSGLLSLAAWTWFAPPNHLSQHILNYQSPSHDGAFVLEAFEIKDVKQYLADFPHRAATPPERMKGTRVISNPPATTLLAYSARHMLESTPRIRDPLENDLLARGVEKPLIRAQMASGMLFAWMLSALTCIGALVLAAALAQRIPAPAAWAVALICVSTPAMMLFSPGKDPAQLLTVATPLLFWMIALRRAPIASGFAAGVAVGIGVFAGLVHLWAAAVVLAASVAAEIRENRANLLNASIGAALGLAVFASVLYVVSSANLIAICSAVVAAQNQVTRGPHSMPLTGQLLGIPMFPLFAGAGLAVLMSAVLRERHAPRDATARFGGWLIVISVSVMLATIGYTNAETPRLWLPFATLLTIGSAFRLAALRENSPASIRWLAVLVFIHVLSAGAVWSMMDMREAEMRLITGRILN